MRQLRLLKVLWELIKFVYMMSYDIGLYSTFIYHTKESNSEYDLPETTSDVFLACPL